METKKRWNTQNRNKNQKGSYTVEAALLMGIVLSVFVAVIYLMFCLHDQGMMQGCAHEAASMISLHADEENTGEGMVQNLIQGRMLAAGNSSMHVSGGKSQAAISCQGDIGIPPLAAVIAGKNQLHVEGNAMLTIRRPTVLIQKLRGAAKIVNRIRGD